MDDRISKNAARRDSEPLSRTFRIPKSTRNSAIVGLVSSLLFGLGSTCLFWRTGPAEMLKLTLYFLPIWLLLIGSMIRDLILFRCYCLSITDGRIDIQGIFRSQKLALTDLESARWGPLFQEQLKLKSHDKTATIALKHFNKEEQLWLIHYFRNQVPVAQQQNWPQFCLRIALPLLKPKQDEPREIQSPREPGPNDVLYTRKDWDRMILIMTGITTLIALFTTWILQKPGYLFLPLAALIWWFLRFAVPEEGRYVTPLNSEKGCLFLLWWTLIFFLLLILMGITDSFREHRESIFLTGAVIWAAPFFWFLYKAEPEAKRKQLEITEQAVKEWESEVALRFSSIE